MRGRRGLDRDDEMRARDVCELLRVVWEREGIYQKGTEWSSSSPWKTKGSEFGCQLFFPERKRREEDDGEQRRDGDTLERHNYREG